MVNIYSLNGEVIGKLNLPEVFNAEYRPDLIQRAVVALQSQRRQPYGVSEEAGMRTSAAYFGRRRKAYRMTINRGMSRLPREKTGGGGLGKVRMVPQSVGGREAHPPKKEKKFAKKINNKEYKKALKSAIAALAMKELSLARGHKIPKEKEIPLVTEDEFEKLKKTKEVIKVLNALGLESEILRAKEKKKIRAGKGKMRGRRYKKKKSLLIVVNEDHGIISGARNIPGVDVVKVQDLNVELLAPGTHPGRISLWTKMAILNLEEKLF